MSSFTSQVYDVSHPEPHHPYSIKLHLTRVVRGWSVSQAYIKVLDVRFHYLLRSFTKHLLSAEKR